MGASRRFCEGWPISTTSYLINVALNTLANVAWKSKAAQSQHRTGSSICKSSPQAAFSEWLICSTTKLGGMWDFLKAARSWPELERWMFAWVDDIGALYRLNQARLEVWDETVPFTQQPLAFVERHRELETQLRQMQ